MRIQQHNPNRKGLGTRPEISHGWIKLVKLVSRISVPNLNLFMLRFTKYREPYIKLESKHLIANGRASADV